MDGGAVGLGSLHANAIGRGQTETVASIAASVSASVVTVGLAEGNARQKEQCLFWKKVSKRRKSIRIERRRRKKKKTGQLWLTKGFNWMDTVHTTG